MIEEGPEWIAHQKTRGHRRLAGKIKRSNDSCNRHSTSPEKRLGEQGKWKVDDSSFNKNAWTTGSGWRKATGDVIKRVEDALPDYFIDLGGFEEDWMDALSYACRLVSTCNTAKFKRPWFAWQQTSTSSRCHWCCSFRNSPRVHWPFIFPIRNSHLWIRPISVTGPWMRLRKTSILRFSTSSYKGWSRV